MNICEVVLERGVPGVERRGQDPVLAARIYLQIKPG